MPTLDDIPTLRKNINIAADDSIAISNKDSGGSTLIQQVPAGKILNGFTHSYLFNFDSPVFAQAASVVQVDVHTFSSTEFVRSAVAIVTESFVISDTLAINAGVHDEDSSGPNNYIQHLNLKTIGASYSNTDTTRTGDDLDTSAEGASQPLDNPTDGDTLRISFAGGGSVNLNTATAGQVLVLVNIWDMNHFKDLVDPYQA